MSEIEEVQAIIAQLERKLASAEPASREYYELCLAGSQRWLRKIEAGEN